MTMTDLLIGTPIFTFAPSAAAVAIVIEGRQRLDIVVIRCNVIKVRVGGDIPILDVPRFHEFG